MDRMYDHGVRWVYHLARIVPAGSMYASATMLNFRLQGADEGLHLTIWMMFVVSAGLLALTQHRTYSAMNFGRIATTLAIPSVVRLLKDMPSDEEEWACLHDRIKYVVAEYLSIISLVAFALAVGCPAPAQANHEPDPFGLEDQASELSMNFSNRSQSWSSRSSRAFSDTTAGSKVADCLSEVSLYLKHMGPSSKASSRSGGADSDMSLDAEPGRVDPLKILTAQFNAKVAQQGYQDQEFQTLPQNPQNLREMP